MAGLEAELTRGSGQQRGSGQRSIAQVVRSSSASVAISTPSSVTATTIASTRIALFLGSRELSGSHPASSARHGSGGGAYGIAAPGSRCARAPAANARVGGRRVRIARRASDREQRQCRVADRAHLRAARDASGATGSPASAR